MGKTITISLGILVLVAIIISVFSITSLNNLKKDHQELKTTYKTEILNTLNSCESIEPNTQTTTNCNEVCGNKKCIKEDVVIFDSEIDKWIVDTGANCEMSYLVNNNDEEGGLKLQCLCCSD